ncbi:phosphatidylinositol phosphatase PTPRQ isoform X3 [Mastacembelus armatus]|uniref:phosphatidylinositol phosphatase PTPRQ isoform X3 n=1 Tax=Mastacembelus armatus TaxID=205130 RepID=UPI000E45A5B2|nr:phosphatidylinositol phosphatase PTPRQ isoform X3 [Mastacembelus armatus]
MGGTERLWLLASLCQSFPSGQDPNRYTVTCRTSSNHLVYVEPIYHSACCPNCKISLWLVEDQKGYDITLRACRNDTTLDAKTFHFVPVSLSSFHVYSTVTTALLRWNLQRQQIISTLSLYNTQTQAVTHFSINSLEAQSQYTAKGLQPGTRFKAKVVVTTFLGQLNVILKQTISIGVETAQCPPGWLANERSCFTVKRTGLTWNEAQHNCRHLEHGSHLADLKTLEDQVFVSSHLLNHNNLLLLWTGLNDQKEEGQPRWSDGSSYNLTNTLMTLLPANQTDCFALQRNVTGPGYFLTPFFCSIPLPFICQYQIPWFPSLFSFDLIQVTEHQVELRWSDLSFLNSLNHSSLEIFLQYQEEAYEELGQREEYKKKSDDKKPTQNMSSIKKTVKVPISLTSRVVTLAGLSPGRVYSFSLKASHPAGSTWSLGQMRTAYTRPLPPQNITVGLITASQISVHWMLQGPQHVDGWTFVVRYVDLISKQERIVGMTNISRSFETGWLQSHIAVIGGLESYRKYMVEVSTVTQYGIEGCGQLPLIVQTAVRAPSGLTVLKTRGNVTLCWISPSDDPPDGYYIAFHPLSSRSTSSLWINQSSPGALWVNQSVCVDLGTFTPGQTYDIGVVSLKGQSRSQRTSIIHTTTPMPVQVAVPVSVSTNTVQLYIQRPQLGLIDGVKVCVCPGVCDTVCEGFCEYTCYWYALPAGVHIITLSSLSPGTEYQLRVYSTNRGQMGPPYSTHLIRTGLAPPSRVREGLVTDSSIELLWDPAQGQAHSYEVICLNCDHSHMVQKVLSPNAVFYNLTPGRRYHFAVRTEKESFIDSFPVTINITATPSQAELSLVNKTTSTIQISWGTVKGVLTWLILSIRNRTSHQELIISQQEPRSYTFEGLAPGSQYTVEVIGTSGEKKSKPATMILNTIPEVPQEVALSEHAVTSVFVTWRPPPGQAEGYKLVFGQLSVDRKSWTEVLVGGTSYEISDLIPGSDYGFIIQSVLGSDTSHAVHREFSTHPAGLCTLHLANVSTSSVSVSWDSVFGEFDFHRVTVANSSVTNTLIIPKEERVAVVTGLVDGCSYNVSAERVRGVTAGSAASLTVTTVPARVRGLRVANVSAHAFSLRWAEALGCVDHYQVSLEPNQGKVTVHPVRDGYIQADVISVSPRTQYTVTVTAASSSNISPGVSRMINTNESVPGPPLGLEGEAVGSNGILLSWTMPPGSNNIEGYVIRYKEVCPYPDVTFTQVIRNLDVPETLITDFISGSTYLIQVAAKNAAGIGPFSKSLYIKTAESPPGLVTNLTAFAQNHTFVVVTWFLPHRINGLITKFAVKAKHARTGQTVRILEVIAEDIMTGALPHCNDAADILSRATISPLGMTASSPPITLSAVPAAASWSVPISVGVDKLRPYTAYLFEVSAFTSDGEGQIASTMVRMPESAPEDPPQNFSVLNMTSRSVSVIWNSPKIITGKFTYMLYLYGPAGYLYENSTADMRFAFSGLNPYRKYKVVVRAKAAGEVGPAAEETVITPAEAPSAVQDLKAIAEDSVSILVSWRSPAQPNGPITQYRLQVLVDNTMLQDITLTADVNTPQPNNIKLPGRTKRAADLSVITSPPSYTATVSDHTLSIGMTAYSFTDSGLQSTNHITNTDVQNTTEAMVTMEPRTSFTSISPGTNIQSSDTAVFGTSAFSPTSVPPATLPPWLTKQSHAEDMTTDSSFSALTPGQLLLSTQDASVIGHLSTRNAASSGTTGVTVKEEVMDILSERLSYLVSDLDPFTEYTFRVTASTTEGAGPATDITEKTREHVPSSVLEVSYQNISSTSILVTWIPPLNPNGRITHYTVYGLKMHSRQALKWVTNTTSILITDLDKYTGYKLRVAASTAVGESSLSEEDDIFVFTLEDEPDSPPVNLTGVDTSPSTMTLAWSAPEKANGVIQYYEVLYENESFSALMNTSSNRVTLMNLKPFSYYNVSVRAFTRYGHGNQTSETLYLLSGEDVPGSPPYGLSYKSVSPSEVNVTWQPPLLPNGVITHYSLELWNSTNYLNFTSPTNYIHITHLRKYAHYRIVVQAHTRVGPGNYSSEPLNITTVEDVPSDSVRNMTAQIFSSTAIIVSWDPPLEPNGRPYYLLTLQEAGTPPNVSNQGTPAVNKTIKHTTTDNVFLFTKLKKYFPYVLTVTPATGAGPAYNHTSTMYLRTDDDIPSSPPLLVSTRNLSSSSIAVVWQRPLEANGEITEYILTLFGPGGSNITHTPNTSFIFTKLLPYTSYNLTITAATRKGSGPYLLLQLHTDEGGPISPPRNLTIYNHTAVSVWLSWEPPLEPNGVVIQYGFRIQNLITNTVTHRNSSGPSTTEYLSGFRPHSSYEISVYSYTRMGHGNQFSSPVTFTTNESVSDAVGNLSCSGVSWDSIRLFWEHPAQPNGQILFYEIQVEIDLQSYTYQSFSPEYTVTGLSPKQEYVVTVAAVNSAGPGNSINCTASTLSESVPAAPRFLTVSQVAPNNVTLQWAPPLSIPGLLKEYHVIRQLLSAVCEPRIQPTVEPSSEDELTSDCVESSFTDLVTALDSSEVNHSITLGSLAKYRYYRFRVAAMTNAGVGEYTQWIYARTLAGNPDAPPRDLKVSPTSNSFRIVWNHPAVLSGPTSYLVQVKGPGLNISIIQAPGELTTVIVTNLTAFTRYLVTVTAFTGPLEYAASEGKATGPFEFQTLEEEPRDPPKNVTVSAIPEEVNRVKVTFTPPEEPNGNITAYFVYIYEENQLVKNFSLSVIQRELNTLTAVIDGLKGGHSYSIQISARNGVGRSPPSPHVQITTGIKAPAKPTQRPQAVLGHGGVAMVTHRTITIHMPACFYSDDNGPIAKIQVIVAESGVKDQNLTNWRNAFFDRPAPYFTDKGFPNPPCFLGARGSRIDTRIRVGRSVPEDGRPLVRRNHTKAGTYVIGESNGCMGENNTDSFCNGPLKPNTVYVFKFRATNINGQYTDSEYSDHVRTAVNGLLTREEQIILGVLLSFFLAVLLIIIICSSVKIHQRKKEGGTYSPREAEIIETKCKLDQLIAVADLEMKQEKLNRYSSFFFRRKEIYVIQLLSYRKSLKPINKKSFLQHVEDLCANDNARFQEEFAELPKLLQDLATTDADLPWNKSKNRFPNIKPYNNNRVKLLSEPGTAGSDYINASFVSGYLCPNEFIATQGPLPGTVADFWRMIWETGTRTIAMLTQCYEKGRIRCHKYWPEDNKPMSVFSDILISKVSEEVFPDWTVRTLKVEKNGNYILVRHFNYTSWPEHGVPESCSTFIKFVKAVRAHRHDNTTIVVHCSAGVGRTGVFIALDHLIQHIRDHDFVDIYGLVAELRSERMCMVQNLAQYIFLHQSTLELLNNKGNSQSIWFVSYSALEKMDSLDAMEGDVELEWEETTM